jgi:hypothetical protein
MTPYSTAPVMLPRNALIAVQPAPPPRSVPNAQPGPAAALASTIGHAAVLSDTPEKWAATMAILKKNGIDPEGYEDFHKGRPAAIAAAGLAFPQDEPGQSD